MAFAAAGYPAGLETALGIAAAAVEIRTPDPGLTWGHFPL